MAPTVDDRRNEIRTAVGRHERIESTAFTKEALAAICAAVDEAPATNSLPAKARMRSQVRRSIDVLEDDAEGSFRKAELDAIAAAVDESSPSE